jgi:tuftelin-interacting protein 11
MAAKNLPTPQQPLASAKKEKRWTKMASLKKAPVLTKNESLAMRAEQEQDEQPAVVQKVIDMRGFAVSCADRLEEAQ